MTETEAQDALTDEDVIVTDDAPAPEPDAAPEPKPQPRKPRFSDLEQGDEEYGPKVQKRLSKVIGQRKAAEARAAAEAARANELERRLSETQRHGYTVAEQALTERITATQAKHRQAFADSDPDAMASTSAELAELAAKKAQVQAEAQRQPAPQQRQPSLTPRTQAFIDANPWFHTDEDARDVALAADAAARRKNLRPDTDEYENFVLDRVRKLHPEHFDDEEETEDEEVEVEQPRRAAPAVAPARRSAPGVPQRSNKLPPLTSAEASMARSMGVPLTEWAKRKRDRLAKKV